MARISITECNVSIAVSARETYDWAHRPGASWPCSTLSNKRFRADYDSNGLCDLTVNGRDECDIDLHELNAIVADMLSPRLPRDHALHFVTVGQFE